MLRNEWTEAWEQSDTPDPLPMPLQGLITIDMIMRTNRYAEAGQNIAFNPVGQVVGRMNQMQPAKNLVSKLVDEYYDAADRIQSLMPKDD
jgi:NAD(P)H-dependent flavin oxidoreductase YrpB (nitropropane dioxygenase family)